MLCYDLFIGYDVIYYVEKTAVGAARTCRMRIPAVVQCAVCSGACCGPGARRGARLIVFGSSRPRVYGTRLALYVAITSHLGLTWALGPRSQISLVCTTLAQIITHQTVSFFLEFFVVRNVERVWLAVRSRGIDQDDRHSRNMKRAPRPPAVFGLVLNAGGILAQLTLIHGHGL